MNYLKARRLSKLCTYLGAAALVSGQLLLLATSISCGAFASSDGFETYKGSMPDKSFVGDADKLPSQELKSNFSKESYPRPVLIVDGKTLLDKTYTESAFSALAVLSDKFGIDLQNPLLKTNDSQSMSFLYNTAFKRGYRVLVLPSFSHGLTFEDYYKENKTDYEKEEDFLFVGVDFKFKEGDESVVKPGHAVSLNFKTEESSFIIGYAAARYLAETYSDPEERVLSAFAGVPFQGATDYVFGFLEGLKYWNQTQSKKVKFLGNKVDTSSGFDAASPEAGAAINRSISGGKTKIVFPVAGGSITRRLLSETESNKDIYVIGVDTDVAKALPEYKDKILTSSLKNISTWVYKVLEDYYTGSKKLLEDGKNSNLYKGIKEDWVGYAPSTIKDSEKINKYLAEAKEIFLGVLDGKVKSDWATDYKMYQDAAPQEGKENPIPAALASLVSDINSLFESAKKKS